MSTNQTRWAVHYVDGPTRRFIAQGVDGTLEEARMAGCQAIATEHNTWIGSERKMVHEELADGKTLEEAISQQFLLRRWLDELVNGGWGFGTDEALTEVMDCTEDAGSVAECLRKVTGHEHQFAILRSGDFEYWIEYNADCRCVAPWGGQCNLKYYEERRR